MTKSRTDEELRQVLAGHLYDLKDATSDQRGKLLAVAKPTIIFANEAIIAALKNKPKDIFKLTPRQYEELVAELFHDMGYDVTLTKATRDGGKIFWHPSRRKSVFSPVHKEELAKTRSVGPTSSLGRHSRPQRRGPTYVGTLGPAQEYSGLAPPTDARWAKLPHLEFLRPEFGR